MEPTQLLPKTLEKENTAGLDPAATNHSRRCEG